MFIHLPDSLRFFSQYSFNRAFALKNQFRVTFFHLRGLSIKPKTTISKVERLKMFAESLGLNPDEALSRDALAMPHRTIADSEQMKIQVFNEALKQAIIQELRQDK
jgi:hypothetical protein